LRVPFEAAGHRPDPFGVDVTAEAAEDVPLAEAGARAPSGAAAEGLPSGRALRVRIVVRGRQARRACRQGVGHGLGADAQTQCRRAVVGGREARADSRVGRRAGHVWIARAAMAHVRAHAGARPGAGAVRVAVARSVGVRPGVAREGAHRARLDAGGVGLEIPGQVELHSERQADGQSAAATVGRAVGVPSHDVDPAAARRRTGRVRNRLRRAEQTPGVRAFFEGTLRGAAGTEGASPAEEAIGVDGARRGAIAVDRAELSALRHRPLRAAVATRLGRRRAGQRERRVAARGHFRERVAHVGDGKGERETIGAAAPVEAAASEVREGAAN